MFRCFLPQYGSCCLIRHPKPLGYVLKPLGMVFRLFVTVPPTPFHLAEYDTSK